MARSPKKACQFCQPSPMKALYKFKNYVFQQTGSSQCFENIQHLTINHTLYHKYASSQNYYYTKELNEILANHRVKSAILFNVNIQFNSLFEQDFITFDEEDEFLKRFYNFDEYPSKCQILSEFYKFHKDLPRWSVSKDILRILNYYYDKKRKIEYFKIQKIIEHENNVNPNQPPKGIVGDKPLESESTPITPQSSSSEEESKNQNVENILEQLRQDTSSQKAFQHASYIQFEEEDKKYSVLFGCPNLNTTSKNSIEIQQMISMLTIDEGVNNRFTKKNDNQKFPQSLENNIKQDLQPETGGTINLEQVDIQPIQDKKKMMQKKMLRLDDFALSLSTRQPQLLDTKMPLSARYQPFSQKLMEQSIQVKTNNIKHSKNSSKEKTTQKENKQNNIENLIQSIPESLMYLIDNQKDKSKDLQISQKTPRNIAQNHEKQNKIVHFEGKTMNLKEQQKQNQKKMFNQMLMPTEIKKLELKVLKGLQDLQKLKNSQDHTSKMLSYDQKSLHQMLSKFTQKKKGSLSQRLCESTSQFESQNFSRGISITPRGADQIKGANNSKNFNLLIPHKSQENMIKQQLNSVKSGRKSNHFSGSKESKSPPLIQMATPFQSKPKIEKLDLHKLINMNRVDKQPPGVQSARSELYEDSQVFKKESALKTDRVPSSSSNERIKMVHKVVIPGLNLNLMPSRANNIQKGSPCQKTPKGYNSARNYSNLMQWQIKAIQAAQREYNLIQAVKQK